MMIEFERAPIMHRGSTTIPKHGKRGQEPTCAAFGPHGMKIDLVLHGVTRSVELLEVVDAQTIGAQHPQRSRLAIRE
jgi:hypothetical protein